MKIVIEKKYLILPINVYATPKKLCFYKVQDKKQTLVMDFDCKLDFLTPTYTAYLDVSRFCGAELEYSTIPQMEFLLEQTDEKTIDALYQEEFRPTVHFTPQIGWINDPNGLIKYQGKYHMFYQYNPFGTEWGNMHWGHAISDDLLFWDEQDIALFPDEMGTMYSGSAIEDRRNVSGLQSGKNPPMLLFYTAAGDRSMLSKRKDRTQCLAYSNDGGKAFVKYKKNPVMDTIERYNRDPKVVWVEDLSAYVTILYLDEDRYALLTSTDLLDWHFLQEITISGERECPDIMRFSIKGRDYWVIAGATDKYVVGRFENKLFVPKTATKTLSYSPALASYAAQSFSGIDDGRVLRIAWDNIHMPSQRVPNQMSFPTELKLEGDAEDLYLTARPAEELERLYTETHSCEGAEVTVRLERAAYDISLMIDRQKDATVKIFGHVLQIKASEKHIVFQKVKIPLLSTSDTVDLRMIVDRCSLELFADGGRACATFPMLCDYNLPYLQAISKDGTSVLRLTAHRLRSIYEQQ